jgi:hypothetical protein
VSAIAYVMGLLAFLFRMTFCKVMPSAKEKDENKEGKVW